MSIEAIIQEVVNLRAVRPPRPNDPIDYGRYLDDLKREPSRETLEQQVRAAFSGFDLPSSFDAIASRPFVTPDVAGQLISIALSLPWLDALVQQNIERQKLKSPHDHKGDLRDFFRGTPLIKFFEYQVPISVPPHLKYSGTYICGPPGAGKTVLLQHLVLKAMEEDCAIILMDSKRDEDFIGMFRNLSVLQDRLLVIDPGPIALNPLSVPHTTTDALLDLNIYIMEGLGGTPFTDKQAGVIKYSLRAIIEHYPNPNIIDLIEVMKDGVPTHIKLSPDLERFFRSPTFHTDYKKTSGEIGWRLNNLLFSPVISSIFHCKEETKLDLRKEIDARKFIILNANITTLGPNACSFLQRLFMALLLNAVRTGTRAPCYLFADEIQTWAANDKALMDALDTLRSAKVACHLAHQRVRQMSEPVLDALTNCAITYVHPQEDATYFASRMRRTADELRNLPEHTWACHARGVGTFNVKVPLPPAMPQRASWLANFSREPKQTTVSKWGDRWCQPQGTTASRFNWGQKLETPPPPAKSPKVETPPKEVKAPHKETPKEVDPDIIEMKRSKDWRKD